MTAQLGLNMIVEVDSDGAGTFQTVAGLQVTSIRLNKENIDVTSQDDASRYRQLLRAGGVKSATITGRGVFKDAAADLTVRTNWANDNHRDHKITIPSFFRISGSFSTTDIEYSGEHNKEVQWNVTFESAGDLTFTAL